MTNIKKLSSTKRLRSPLTFLKDGHHRHASGIYNIEYDYNQEILVNKNVNVVFQPIINLNTDNFFAFEALSRPPLNSPLEHKSPFAIIKETNHKNLDRICLENIFKSIHKIEKFDELNHEQTHFFVNCLLANTNFLRRIPINQSIKEKTTIEFDINHTFFDLKQFIKSIHALKRDNYKIALDDVGETDIDFKLINIINPEFIKIDISVIFGIADDDEKKRKAEKIIQVANRLGAEIIAEGIERKNDLKVIQSMGVALIQGFLFSKPMKLIPQKRKEIDNIIKRAA